MGLVKRVAAVVVPVGLVVGGVAYGVSRHGSGDDGTLGECRTRVQGLTVVLTDEQARNASLIAAIAIRRGMPAHAATVALATSLQESRLYDLRGGDRDSLGLFQQRPSQGWGSRAQVLDPVHATNAFYDALEKVKGYEQMEITKVAQEVQKSAYPAAYADHEQEGRILASALSGHSPAGLGCRLDPAEAGDPEGLAAALRTELGVRGTPQGRTITVRAGSDLQAWNVGSWAVAKASAHGVTRVRVGERQWTRTRDEDGWSWQKVSGPDAARTVTITFAAPPAS